MAGKIRAATDARASQDTLIIARTDAIAEEGLAAALDRANLYAEAGADVLFVEAPGSRDQLSAVATSLGGKLPLMANMVEGGKTPVFSAPELEAIGYALVIFPGGIARAIAHAARDFYATLVQDGSTAAFRNRMFDFDALNEVIGTPEMLALGKSYEGGGGE